MVQKQKQTNKYLLLLLIIGATLLGGWYKFNQSLRPTPLSINELTDASCTKDAFTCTDGSKIGRTPPTCEFICPGHVSLSASPTPTNVTLGQNFKLDLNAYPGANSLVAVQLELIYDPEKLNIFGLDHSDYLPNYLANPIFGSGKFETTLSVQPDTGGVSTWGTLGKLNITPLALGTHSIEFGSNTIATIIGSDTNAFQSNSGLIINVFNPGDINKDKTVDLFDYTYFVLDYGKTGYSPADFNSSSKVDLFDYTIFVANYGKTSP